MKYVILQRQKVDALQKLVEIWVNDKGWKLHGSPFVSEERELDPRPRAGVNVYHFYNQAIVKEE
jgi:hypothetical protein